MTGCDSLPSGGPVAILPDTLPPPLPVVTPGDVFGPVSELCTSTAPPQIAPRDPFSGAALYQLSVLGMGIAYCCLLYYFRGAVVALGRMLRGKLYTTMLLEQANHTFMLFMNFTTVLGLVTGGVSIARLISLVLPADQAQTLPWWIGATAVPMIVGLLALIMLYRYVALRAVGWLTLCGDLTGRLWALRRMAAALCTLVIIPPLVLLPLGEGTMFYVMAALVGLLWLAKGVFIQHKVYVLFISEDISILHWFLYLCTVEIFPLSLPLAVLWRTFG